MNEELLNELAEAMKRREKSLAAVDRWTQQLNDANEDIAELSGRIADHAVTHGNPTPEELEEAFAAEAETPERTFEPVQWTPDQV